MILYKRNFLVCLLTVSYSTAFNPFIKVQSPSSSLSSSLRSPFQLSDSLRQPSAGAASSDRSIDENNSRKKKQVKRRFLQTEHQDGNEVKHFRSNHNKNGDDESKLQSSPFYSNSNPMNSKKKSDNTVSSENTILRNKIRKKQGSGKHPMMRTDLSLDELENVMAKRWGNEDESYGSGSSKQSKQLFNERKVLQRVRQYQREYYDEDDEGYEESGGSEQNSGINDNTDKPESLEGGFFLRQQQNEPKSSISVSRVRMYEEESESNGSSRSSNTDSKRTSNKPKRPTPEPILNEQGNEQYLTISKAEEQTRLMQNAYVMSGGQSERGCDSFVSVGISHPVLLQNLGVMGCESPLPVQIKACSSIIEGKDVLIGTHTGSGKTLAFLAPLAERLLNSSVDVEDNESLGKSSFVRAIIVAPGRELASQIVSVARQLLQGTGLTISLSIGGTPFTRNVEKIRKTKPDIIVGTPGRIAELVVGKDGEKKGKVRISSLSTLILDEFDALLQYQAHREPTSAIVWATRRQKRESLQTVLCSATAADMKPDDLDNYLRDDYAYVKTEEDALVTQNKPTKVSLTTIHGVVHVQHRRFALETLRKILNTDPNPQQALIFVDSPRRAEIVVDKLADMGIIAASLHGGSNSEKGERTDVNRALREGYVGIVVATEMAARGIDAPYLTHVINLDLPTDASHYAHRAGRCGRGGRPGVVINFTTGPKERKVPRRFADALGVELFAVDPQKGLLKIVSEESALVSAEQ